MVGGFVFICLLGAPKAASAQAEIMRVYVGWDPADLAQFQAMMLNIFYPMNHDFLVNHNGACISHYWCKQKNKEQNIKSREHCFVCMLNASLILVLY